MRSGFGAADVNAHRCRAPVTDPQIDRVATIGIEALRRIVAGLEMPGARRSVGSGKPHRDGVIAGCEIVLAGAVAQAGLGDPAGAIDAESSDHVAGPAASVALPRQNVFRF